MGSGPYRRMRKSNYCLVAALLVVLGLTAAGQGQIGPLPGRIWGQLARPANVASYLSPVSTAPNLVEGREFYAPQGVAVDVSGATPAMYVADSQNNRVLGWKDAAALQDAQSGKWGAKADVVIGQLDFNSTIPYGQANSKPLSAFSSGLDAPSAVAVDAQGNLWVFDSGNNRILRFPQPMANIGKTQRADLILGQASMTSGSANQGASVPSEYTLNCYASGVGLMQGGLLFDAAGNLFVADPANNRILIFDHTSVTQQGDTGNPISNIPAKEAIGQPDFVTAAGNPGPASGNTVHTNLIDKTKLRFPTALAMDSAGNLFVSDAIARVLVYPSAAQVRGGAASRVLGIPPQQQSGQPALAAVNEYAFGAFVASNTFVSGPGGLFVIADNLYVTDTFYHRILQFPPIAGWAAEATAAMSPKAVAVFGQGSFNTNLGNGVAGGVPSAVSFLYPGAAAYANNELYVADSGNNRVLVFDGIATATSLSPAVRVAGQPGFTYNAINLIEGREFSLGSISWTVGTSGKRTTVAPVVAIDKTSAYVYVSDPGNHRVLAFSDYRKLDGTQIADFVIGQTDLSSNLVNSPANSATAPGNTGLNTPTGLAVDSAGNLWVADTGNGRVVRFPAPFANRDRPATADLVLGKSEFESTLTESSASSMSRPVSLAFTSNGDLWVVDVAYNRVLRFPQAAGLTNGSAADLVLGQPDFTTVTPGTGTGDQVNQSLSAPLSIAIDASDRLYVTDTSTPRIMVWDVSSFGNPQSGSQGYGLGLLDSTYIPLSVTIHPDPDNQVILYADSAGRLVKMPDYVSMALGATIDKTAVIGSYGARSITIDPAGNIYASDSANRIAVHYDSAGLTNAANGFQLIAPLTLAAMRTPGIQLVSTEVDASGAPYPTALGGYSLLVNGVAAPVYAVTSDTVKFVVPNATPVNEAADFMIVKSDTGAVISYVRNPVYVAAPAFLQDQKITGGYSVKALNSDGSANSSSKPAKAGTDITLLLTGSGFVQGAPADGTAGATPVVIDPSRHDTLVINGAIVAMKSATLDQNTPGVWRITATIPSNAAGPVAPVGLYFKGLIANWNPAATTPGISAAYGSGIYVSH
jgi:uncharacterized protein (TIGR03437 family)